MRIANTLPELIGRTPLLRLERFAPGGGLLAKLESFNPLSSAKDRAGLYMIRDAEERGILRPGAVIVEPTSGNTGVALAYIGRLRGYRVVLTMPETMSAERRALLSALGAELVLTDGAKGMAGAIEKASELLETTPGAWMPDQFNNPANARAHYETTGPELWEDTEGNVDVLVAAVGSGGTITGTGRYLKERNPAVRVVAVEPAESPVLSGGRPGPHKIQGIGAGFVPGTLELSVVDEIMTVTGDEAYAAACGRRIKLLGRAIAQADGKVCAYVEPHFVGQQDPLAGVEDVFNAILVKGDATGDVMFYGRGAGKLPTASAVVADVIAAARQLERASYRPWNPNRPEAVVSPDTLATQWYVRLAQGTLEGERLTIPGAAEGESGWLTPAMTRPELEQQLAGKAVLAVIRVLD